MTRSAVAFDRIAVFLTGLGIAAVGVLAIAWERGYFGAGAALRVTVRQALSASWWTWAVAAAGVVLIVLGLRWLATHRWPRKASRVALAGPGAGLTADAASVAAAAADALEAESAVLKANGTATVDRGNPTVTLTATVPAHRGISVGIAAADRTAQTVGAMLGDTVAVRTVLRIATKHRSTVA